MSGATFTDLFCGAGGSSIGGEHSGGTLILGLNHWAKAVETHAHNFQDADHDCEDVSSLTTNQIRRYPDSDILLASPECTNHSLAKGAQRRKPQAASLFDDGPGSDAEQERSRATMWDVVRFAEQKLLKGRPYKAVIVENVVDAFKWGADDDGGLFDAWLMSLRALGYEHEIVFLNSMFAHHPGMALVPQSRDRMYVVLWLKTLRRPNLRIEPVSWCPACRAVVDGQQTWKRLDRRPWGRYGPQYFYGCPVCRACVLPGAAPAIEIIDSTLDAQLIGERKRPLAPKTRERIRRGLERLDREPFAVRLLQGGIARPMTLPLVTLTGRHDMAMVTPVAGNTYERSPGNRARDVRYQALDTVHGTLDRALVLPPMGEMDARDASTRPVPTQTTPTRAAVVHCRGVAELQRHGDVRDVADPVHTVRAGGQHHALVMGNRHGGVPREASENPAQTVCTGETLAVISHFTGRGDLAGGIVRDPDTQTIGSVTSNDHHSLVVPYQRGNDTVIASQEPSPTLTTRDRIALVVPAGGTWSDHATLADSEPLPTQTATEARAIVWTDDDIDGCRFRMFALHEISGAMRMDLGPAGGAYVVLGNKREQMAQYGNAVTPPATALLLSRILPILDEASAT